MLSGYSVPLSALGQYCLRDHMVQWQGHTQPQACKAHTQPFELSPQPPRLQFLRVSQFQKLAVWSSTSDQLAKILLFWNLLRLLFFFHFISVKIDFKLDYFIIIRSTTLRQQSQLTR